MVCISIFLKEPVPGKVKTRIADTVGDQKACDIYKSLVAHQVHHLPPNIPVFIHYHGSEEIMRAWLKQENFSFRLQCNGNLGERLDYAHKSILGSGQFTAMLSLGGDCPYITQDVIEEALSELKSHDIVLGPAKDGGYYLIGMKKYHPNCFTNITWSSEKVLSETIKNIEQSNLTFSLLKELEDIDTIETWHNAIKKYPALTEAFPK